MKQIKTIICVTSEQDFDNMVNIAIRDGWTLVKRDILPPCETTTIHYHRALYAELERDIEKCCETCKHNFDEDECDCDGEYSGWEAPEE